jgi:cobalamin biosynthesis protein CobD/CbiB
VLSTSVRNGGQVDWVRHLVNHQSCEGTAHGDRHRVIVEDGLDVYHDRVCTEVALPPDATAVMGTAANMNYVALVTEVDEELAVTAAVTAGVEGNATAAMSLGVAVAIFAAAGAVSVYLAWVVHAFLLYSLLALGDLLHHVWRIERAVRDTDLPRARNAVSAIVGRDTVNMDAAACRRAAVESLSESLTDGFVSPLLWYVLAGIPGIVVFKVASTMESMVGYKTPRYLRFGWCGARLDDVMNYVPARIT